MEVIQSAPLLQGDEITTTGLVHLGSAMLVYLKVLGSSLPKPYTESSNTSYQNHSDSQETPIVKATKGRRLLRTSEGEINTMPEDSDELHCMEQSL